MAAGCTQPGGAGTTILIEDNAHADAGGDGSYSFADIAAKFPVDAVDLGTTPKTYRMKVSLTNGDGVGTSVTTLKDSNCTVVFDAAKVYSVSATGRTNRFTEFGVKVAGTHNSGRQGVRLQSGGATTINGNCKFYGSILETVSGAFIFAPGTTGLAYEMINCLLYSPTAGVSVGNAFGVVDTAYNVDIIGGSADLAAVVNFNVTNAERMTVGINPGTIQHIRTGFALAVNDLVFIGTVMSSQCRATTVDWTMIAPTWDQTTGIGDPLGSGGSIHEWWPYNIAVIDGSRIAIPGLPVSLKDGLGATVMSTTTNSFGNITFGSGITAGSVKVVSHLGTTITYHGPFELRVNADGATNPNWPSRITTFEWDTIATWLTIYNQYQPLFDVVQLGSPSGNPTNWVECSL